MTLKILLVKVAHSHPTWPGQNEDSKRPDHVGWQLMLQRNKQAFGGVSRSISCRIRMSLIKISAAT